ncbi:hypothetical protein CVT24_010502 [Panaeolus cyanescens]|uniref:Uncharacterized protein n=1 Tax=Panaeolus cyanescens TaxID=181874 RepID=A0A409YLQ5_9AGAR|nr:hypothetical protein CVT24_010502 [Panaeolus cyanescens]
MPLDWTRRTESLSRVHSFSISKRRKPSRPEIPDFPTDDAPVSQLHDELLDDTDSVVQVETPNEPFKPFDTLPLELQLEIFSHCLPPSPSFDPNEAPLLIARVCRTWRTVVLSTPRLWSTFEVEITGSPGGTVSAYDLHIMSTMKHWLQRSKNYPLSVRVSHIPSSRIHDPRSAELLSLLIPEIRRWRHVELLIPAASIRPLQTSLPEGFPSLRSLTLQLKGFWATEPALDLSLLNIPWHQLTTLNLQLEQNHLLTLDQYLHILEQTENLRDCTIGAQCILASDTESTVSLTRLESLQLTLHEPMESSPGHSPESSLVNFLNSLSMSKLHTLKIGWLMTSPEGVWQTVHSDVLTILSHIASSLRVLSIAYLPVKEHQLLEYLTLLPELSDLELRFSLSARDYDPITDRFLSALAVPSDSRNPSYPASPLSDDDTALSPRRSSTNQGNTDRGLVPLLQSLHVESSGNQYTHTELVSMIQSRWDAVRARPRESHSDTSRIPSFYFLSMNPISSALEKRIMAWNAEGLNVTIDSVSLR